MHMIQSPALRQFVKTFRAGRRGTTAGASARPSARARLGARHANANIGGGSRPAFEPFEPRRLINGPISLASLDPTALMAADPLAALLIDAPAESSVAPAPSSDSPEFAAFAAAANEPGATWTLWSRSRAGDQESLDTAATPPDPQQVGSSASDGNKHASSSASGSGYNLQGQSHASALDPYTYWYAETSLSVYGNDDDDTDWVDDYSLIVESSASGTTPGGGDSSASVEWDPATGGFGDASSQGWGYSYNRGLISMHEDSDDTGNYGGTSSSAWTAFSDTIPENHATSSFSNDVGTLLQAKGEAHTLVVGGASTSGFAGAPSMDSMINSSTNVYADEWNANGKWDAFSEARAADGSGVACLPHGSDYSTATASKPTLGGDSTGSAAGLASTSTMANSMITQADVGVYNSTVRINPHGSASGTACSAAWGDSHPVYGAEDSGHIDQAVSITDMDQGVSRVNVHNDHVNGPAGEPVTLAGAIDLRVNGTAADDPWQQHAEATSHGSADGNAVQNVAWTGDLSAQRGGRGTVNLDGDAPQNQSPTLVTQNTVTGDLSVNTPAEVGTTSDASVDVDAGGATRDADARAEAGAGASNPVVNSVSSSADGRSSLDDREEYGTADTHSSGNANVNLYSGSNGSGEALGHGEASGYYERGASTSSGSGLDGASVSASSEAIVGTGVGGSTQVNGSLPIAALSQNSSLTLSAVTDGQQGAGSASGNVTVDANSGGSGTGYSSGYLYYSESSWSGSGPYTFNLGSLQLNASAAQDGTAPSAVVSIGVYAGFDSNGDTTVDQAGFYGTATLRVDQYGVSFLPGGDWWTGSEWSFNSGARTASLSNPTVTLQNVTPNAGDRLLVQFNFSINVTGGPSGASGSFTFNG